MNCNRMTNLPSCVAWWLLCNLIVVFVGVPVVDLMDDGIGCFGESVKRSVRRKLLLKAVEFR